MKPIQVRQADVADYAAIADLLVAAYAPSGMPAGDPYGESLRDVAARAVDGDVWIAVGDGHILGTVTWAPPGSSQREIGFTWGAELAEGPGSGESIAYSPPARSRTTPMSPTSGYPGNPTRSYRTREPVRVIDEFLDWEGHAPQVVQQMRDHLTELNRQGIEAIDE